MSREKSVVVLILEEGDAGGGPKKSSTSRLSKITRLVKNSPRWRWVACSSDSDKEGNLLLDIYITLLPVSLFTYTS